MGVQSWRGHLESNTIFNAIVESKAFELLKVIVCFSFWSLPINIAPIESSINPRYGYLIKGYCCFKSVPVHIASVCLYNHHVDSSSEVLFK